jgi:hypothetical protein
MDFINMLKSSFTKNVLLATSISVLVSGCASNKIAITETIQQQSAEVASQSKFTPEQAIVEAENKLQSAIEQGIGFYSPLHIKQAKESIEQAREYLAEPPSDVKNAPLMSAIAAQKFIDNAYKNKTKVEALLGNALKSLDIVKELDAPSYVPDDYEDALDTLREIIKEIEQGNVADAKRSESDVVAEFGDVEVKTLKVIHLKEAESFYERAGDIDADDFAEISYEKAELKLEAAIDFIEKHYRDRDGVAEIGLEALLACKRAYYVALESKNLVKMTPEDAEKHAIKVMDLFNKMHIAALGSDITPDKLSNQSDAIIDVINDIKAENRRLSQSNVAPMPVAQEVVETTSDDNAPEEVETFEPKAANHQPLAGLEDEEDSIENVESNQETQVEEATTENAIAGEAESAIPADNAETQEAEESAETQADAASEEATSDTLVETAAAPEEVAAEVAEDATTESAEDATLTEETAEEPAES